MASTGITAKLYPPTISSSIPAFYEENGTVYITVPFSMNRAVSVNNISGFSLKVKTAQSNTYITTLSSMGSVEDIISNGQVIFSANEAFANRLKIGSYYKFQLAYNNAGGTIGYYSTVATGKYTDKPTVYIKEGQEQEVPGQVFNFLRTYTGVYVPGEEDKSERPFSYCFSLFNQSMELVESSSWKAHNSSLDTANKQLLTLDSTIDTYTFKTALEDNKVYYVQYAVRTINDLIVYSPLYPYASITSADSPSGLGITAENNFEEGFITISFVEEPAAALADTAVSLAIERSEEYDNFSSWRLIKQVYFDSQRYIPDWSFRDFTVEQGVSYKYRFYLYDANGNKTGQTTMSTPVLADFEDMFLYDGKRQLKVRFNPKVSSFKHTLLEQKVDTIGSKYPYVFRNGVVGYKEFPIGGLISYLSDNNQMFLKSEEDYGITWSDDNLDQVHTIDYYTPVSYEEGIADVDNLYYTIGDDSDTKKKYPVETTDSDEQPKINYYIKSTYTIRSARDKTPSEKEDYKTAQTLDSLGYNLRAERSFKMKLLDWLNNGEIKLFRSPAEGNYLVRLMNVSLSPEDRVGRMIHSFQCQAYEMMELNYDNLLSLGFINLTTEEEYQFIQWSESLGDRMAEKAASYKLNSKAMWNSFSISSGINSLTGDKIYLRLGQSKTGMFQVPLNTGFSLGFGFGEQINDLYFYVEDNQELIAAAHEEDFSEQDLVQGLILTYYAKETVVKSGDINVDGNIVETAYLQNKFEGIFGPVTKTFSTYTQNQEKHEFIKLISLYFHEKTIQEVTENGSDLIYNENIISPSAYDQTKIYKVNDNKYYYIDGNGQKRQINSLDASVTINNDITIGIPSGAIDMSLLDIISSLRLGNKVYCDCVYQEKVVKYKG